MRATVARYSSAGGSTLRIHLSSPPSAFTAGFLLFWLAGWLVALASAVSQVLQHGPRTSGVELVFGTILLAVGLHVLIALAWAARGRPETIIVRDGTLVLRRQSGVGLSSEFPPFTIRNLRILPCAGGILADLTAVRRFWVGGAGRIEIEGIEQTCAFGAGLTDVDADRVVSEVTRRLALAQPGVSVAASRGFAGALRRWSIGIATFMLLTPVALLPFRALVTDRVTCLGVAPGEPEFPLEVPAVDPPGRVLLVPLDDYPAERAQAIAVSFRDQFDIPVAVQPSLVTPSELFDNWQGQLNAARTLALLDQRYPSSDDRPVVIAMTTSDMYIPGSGWRYAFSYRGRERFAVVSSMRMDHGCMGLLPAAPERQLARLRKMIGKNIGVLYYKLPVSPDPRSLVYANVGGPQELDVMSDTF